MKYFHPPRTFFFITRRNLLVKIYNIGYEKARSGSGIWIRIRIRIRLLLEKLDPVLYMELTNQLHWLSLMITLLFV